MDGLSAGGSGVMRGMRWRAVVVVVVVALAFAAVAVHGCRCPWVLLLFPSGCLLLCAH